MLENLLDLCGILRLIAQSDPFLLIVFSASFSLKAYFLYSVLGRGKTSAATTHPLRALTVVLVTSLIGDITWVAVPLANVIGKPGFDFIVRSAWVAIAVFYCALTLMVEFLIFPKRPLIIRQKIAIFISTCVAGFFIAYLITGAIGYDVLKPTALLIEKIYMTYALFPLLITSLIVTWQQLRHGHLPDILVKQLKVLIGGIILPFWFSEFIQSSSLMFTPVGQWINNNHAFASISNMLITAAVYFSSRKIIGLRFLNFDSHVREDSKFRFTDNFTSILEQLSHVTSIPELNHITQRFFKETFNTPLIKTTLQTRKIDSPCSCVDQVPMTPIAEAVEPFISSHEKSIHRFIIEHKILIYDEISFTQFYHPSDEGQVVMSFMESINASIFLPIYEKEQLIAYIVVDRSARRQGKLYSNVERDEMLIFASSLGKIIYLMHHRNLDSIIQREKEIKEELYRKHQEINQYKESIRSFIRSSRQKQIGIIFYKNRRYTFGNQAAKELIPINPNLQEGHPVSKALKQVATSVETYKSPQMVHTRDADGQTLVLSAVPSLEQNNVFITIYHPDVSDVIKRQIDSLHDPSEWDYLLYLETTKSGKLINQLIPGCGETLLKFKIDLLKIALSKKAILVDVPEEDVEATVELLHHVSIRDKLHTLNLKGQANNLDVGIALFGINPIFGLKNNEIPLLKQLDENGTLFIHNIHFLDRETQEHLADFIKYGLYRVLKSNQREACNVRIICSTNQDLQTLVQEGSFSKALFDELRKTTVTMPSLSTLPELELSTLAEGFSEQALKSDEFKNLLALTQRDKNRIAYTRPASLLELKKRVQQIMMQKSKDSDIHEETAFDPAYNISDPDIVEAARLGRQALKSQKVMNTLWNKFKSQSKIATLLGVNRSSVNRRCKDFNLE